MEPETDSVVCPQYELLLEDAVEGQLETARNDALAAHMKSCTNCRAAYEDALSSNRLLRLAEPTPDPGPAFTRMVMARIRTEAQVEERSLWRLLPNFARPFALTATLTLGLMLAYSAYWMPQLPSTETTVSTDARELLSDPGAPPSTPDETLMIMAENEHGK